MDDPRGSEALRERVAWHEEQGRRQLVLAGEDRQKYANSMLTQQLQTLPAGAGCLACALTVKAQLVAFVRALVGPDRILLDTDAETADGLRDHLRRFVVINRVTIEDAPAASWFAIEGPRARAAAEAATGLDLGALAWLGWREVGEGARVLRLGVAAEEGFRLLVPAGAAEAWRDRIARAVEAAGGVEASAAALEQGRIARGWPRWGRELHPKVLPPQAGLADVAISYTKGCYLGQEPISRLKFRGHLPRRLLGLVFDEPAPAPAIERGTSLWRAGEKASVGEVTSAAVAAPAGRVAALAYVQRRAGTPGLEVTVGAPDGVPARLVELPGLRPPGAGS